MFADHAALESIESAAFADLYRAAPDSMRALYGIDVAQIGGATCLKCRQLNPVGIFRRACGLGVERPASEPALEQVLQHISAAELHLARQGMKARDPCCAPSQATPVTRPMIFW